MKATLGWLKEFVDIEIDPPELAEKLTMAGVECSASEEGLLEDGNEAEQNRYFRQSQGHGQRRTDEVLHCDGSQDPDERYSKPIAE